MTKKQQKKATFDSKLRQKSTMNHHYLSKTAYFHYNVKHAKRKL